MDLLGSNYAERGGAASDRDVHSVARVGLDWRGIQEYWGHWESNLLADRTA